MDYTILHDKVLGGDSGEGVLIEDIVVKTDTDREGNDSVYFEIMGVAKTALKDGYNQAAGYDQLEQEVPVKDTVKVLLSSGKDADNTILYDNLNRAFGFKKPLVDGSEEWERFTKDHPDSVYNDIVGQRLYFRAKKSQTKTGEKLSDYFFNIAALAKREEATQAAADKIKAILKKKEDKKKALEEAVSF